MTERTKATKEIAIPRVSSKEQEEGYSIDAQKRRLEEYCMRNGLELIKVFEVVESSTVGDRKQFMEALRYARDHRETIAVVTDKVDRLQRGFKESPLLNDLIERGKIELHFYTENCVIHKYSTSNEKLMWNMNVVMAQSFVDSLRDNVNRSIGQKLRMGEWISTAPIGYLHENIGGKHDRGKGTIVVDKMRAPLIRRLFEEYATGIYTLSQMVKRTKEWGLRNSRGNQGHLCLSHVHSMIQNPFYHGVMKVKKTGKEYPHIYQPIISKELFDQCQQVRLGRSNGGFKWGSKDYIFRGLIKCATTGRIVTADTKTKTSASGNTTQWVYLRAWNPDNPKKKVHVREDKIIAEVQKVFDAMHLDPELLEKAVKAIRNSSDAEKDYYNQKIKELQTEHIKIIKRLDRLTDIFLDGEFNEDEYRAKRKQLEQKRDDITKEMEQNNQADNNFAERLVDMVKIASAAGKTFKGSTIEKKRKLINLVFANLSLNGQKLEFDLRPLFDEFVKMDENGEWCTLEDSNLRPTD
ncbi:recombinase family protein [Rickettsiaceae bacterium]|nr:recombinase family protein [Rickettsiaceae bacterium]